MGERRGPAPPGPSPRLPAPGPSGRHRGRAALRPGAAHRRRRRGRAVRGSRGRDAGRCCSQERPGGRRAGGGRRRAPSRCPGPGSAPFPPGDFDSPPEVSPPHRAWPLSRGPRGLRPRSLRFAPGSRLHTQRPPSPLHSPRRLSPPDVSVSVARPRCLAGWLLRALSLPAPGPSGPARFWVFSPGAVVVRLLGSSPCPGPTLPGRAFELGSRVRSLSGRLPVPDPLAGHLHLSRFSLSVSVTLSFCLDMSQFSLVSRCFNLSLPLCRGSTAVSPRFSLWGLCLSASLIHSLSLSHISQLSIPSPSLSLSLPLSLCLSCPQQDFLAPHQ